MQEITLTIQRENGEGEGIGFLDGKAAFVPGALAGETVRVRAVRAAKRVVHMELLKIMEPSPERVQPPCPYAGSCGGCTMQHMGYARALAQKERRVADCLERIGGITRDSYALEPIVGMGEPWRYRNKATAPIEGGKIGFYRPGSHDVVPIGDCLLQPQSFAAALRATRAWLSEGNEAQSLLWRTAKDGSALAALRSRDAAKGWAERLRAAIPQLSGAVELGQGGASTLFGKAALEEELCGIRSRVSAVSFRQVNTAQAERLYGIVLRLAHLQGGERIVDAYCGAGILTQLLAERGREAIGIEVVPEAIQEAEEAVEMSGLDNVRFLKGTCEEMLPGLSCDVLVLDPPRKGCSPEVVAAAVQANPAKMLYISCDPATLARDAKALAASGYRVVAVAPVDLFPWTAHVESVVLLSKVGI